MLAAMHARISKALNNSSIRASVFSDFCHTFREVGLVADEANVLTKWVFVMLEASESLDKAEAAILDRLENTLICDRRNLVDSLHDKLADRAVLIHRQILPYLQNDQGKQAIDFGCGDGQVTQLVHDHSGLDIHGIDVRAYRAPGVTVPTGLFDGTKTDARDGAYEIGIMTNVIHHEAENERILRELARIVTTKLVVIETVPVGDTPQTLADDHERTFMNDWLYNRAFHDADIPVPGTYETPKGWITRFAAHGWRCTHSEDLGFDQPTIRDVHHLLVFEQ